MNNSIRVLYKKTGDVPQLKIIKDVSVLEKSIVENDLDIIPYEKLFIICSKEVPKGNIQPNITLTFRSVYGDLILVNIDKKKRKILSLSNEDIMWYVDSLMNKAPKTTSQSKKSNDIMGKIRLTPDDSFKYGINSRYEFERALIKVLTTMSITLTSLLNLLRKEDNKQWKNQILRNVSTG